MLEYMTIGKLAKRTGVNVQTIFYYERRRLLAPAKRTDSGYRLYAPQAVRAIRFIKNAQGLGFSLEEIAKLLGLRVSHRNQCRSVKRQAEVRLKLVREKIAGLRSMEQALRRLLKTCAAQGTTDSCPILESLEEGGQRR